MPPMLGKAMFLEVRRALEEVDGVRVVVGGGGGGGVDVDVRDVVELL